MNKKLKIAIAVVAGVAAGYAAYKVGKKILADKNADKDIGFTIDDDDYLDDDVMFDANGSIYEAREEGRKFIEELQSKKEEMTETLFRKPPSEEDETYVNYAQKYKGEEEEKKPMDQNVFEMAPPEDIEQIFFITEEEYEKDHLSSDEIWGKVVMNYYVPDDVLTDDEDNVISEKDIMGQGMIKEFLDHGTKGAEAFYVRNNNFNTDFKIMLINESVLGDIKE